MRKTYISKIVPLALSLELFLTACGSAENAAADEAETTAASVSSSSSAAQTTLETEAETVQETENTSPDLTDRPADELFEYTVYDDHVVINKFILSGEEKIEAKITVPEYIEGVPVTEIGKQAFYYSSGNDRMDFISEIVLPDSIEIIGEGAFSGCGSTIGLKLNLPKSLKELGYNAFGHSGLYGEIVIPGTISRLEDYAFKSCSFLKSVIIENGVTAIGNSCFDECEDLSNVVIPDSVTSIGEYCFRRCTSLSSIDIPESVTVFGRDVFSSTPIVEANQPLIINDILLDHSSAEGEVIIPENVTKICDYAYDHSELTSIVIPDSVTEIGRGAFSFCKKLESVTLPKNITEISSVTFNRCKSLNRITIPDGVTKIGESAFSGSALEEIEIPESTVYFGTDAFKDTPLAAAQQPLVINGILCDWSSASGAVTIPDNVTVIGCGVFSSNESITSVTIHDKVTRIEEMAFDRCTELSEINIPSSVEYIGSLAFNHSAFEFSEQPLIINDILFSWRTAEGDVIIPDGVRSIDAMAFWGCETVTGITVPDSVTYIGDKAFGKCTNLVSVSLPSGAELGEDVFSETPISEDSSLIEYR